MNENPKKGGLCQIMKSSYAVHIVMIKITVKTINHSSIAVAKVHVVLY